MLPRNGAAPKLFLPFAFDSASHLVVEPHDFVQLEVSVVSSHDSWLYESVQQRLWWVNDERTWRVNACHHATNLKLCEDRVADLFCCLLCPMVADVRCFQLGEFWVPFKELPNVIIGCHGVTVATVCHGDCTNQSLHATTTNKWMMLVAIIGKKYKQQLKKN